MSSQLSRPISGGVAVGSLAQAKRYKRRFDAVITLEDPGCRQNVQLRFWTKPAPAHLILAFEDVDTTNLGIRVATHADALEAIEFTRGYTEQSWLVHYYHGVGRSAAIALAILADRHGAGEERNALNQLLAIRPEITPNLVIVDLADQILATSGRLIATVAEWEATVPGLSAARAARLRLAQTRPELYARL